MDRNRRHRLFGLHGLLAPDPIRGSPLHLLGVQGFRPQEITPTPKLPCQETYTALDCRMMLFAPSIGGQRLQKPMTKLADELLRKALDSSELSALRVDEDPSVPDGVDSAPD